MRDPGLLFDDNPPKDSRYIRELFSDREDEFDFGLSLLRGAAIFSRVCAVHGMPRCGKSHLVLRLLLELESLPSFLVLKTNAYNRGTARAILEKIFFDLWKRIQLFPADDLPDGTGQIYGVGMAFLRDIESLVAGALSEASLQKTREVLETAGGGMKLLPPPFEIDATGTVSTRSGMVEQWTRRVPTDQQLVEMLLYQIDLLAALHPGSRIVILVDDLDLLDEPGTTGQHEANQLMNLLRPVAENPATIVLATVRHSFFGRKQDFKDLIEVRLMGIEDLTRVYQKHIDTFNDGEEVFTAEALEWIATGASGRIGVFLHRCYQVWRRFSPRGQAPFSIDHVRQYLGENIRELHRDSGHRQIIEAIEKALRNRRLEVSIPGDLSTSGVMLEILFPIPGRPEAYSISPVYADVIQRLQKDAS